MSQTINRLYDSPERAQKAAHELKTNRFIQFDEVHVVSPADGVVAGGTGATLDGVVNALMKAYVLKAHAKVFAPAILRGGAMVTVHAAFGAATTAIEILDKYRPIASGVPDFSDPLVPWDDATPVSNVLGLPVLLNHDDSFSKFWSVPALSKHGRTTCSVMGLPEISKANGAYVGMMGMPLISHKATFLSSMLGLPVLMKGRGG